MAEVVVAARGRVATHDILAIDFGRHGNVLAYGQTENILRVWKGKAVAACKRVRELIRVRT